MAQSLTSIEMNKIIEQLLAPLSNSELSDLIKLDQSKANERLDQLITDLPIVSIHYYN